MTMIKTLKYVNLVFFILMIVINALANIIPLGHGNTGAISGKYPNLFTPAPITFSIWGIIYVLLAFFIFYQFGLFNSLFAETIIKQIGFWFIISCIMNIGWIFSWHYDVTWLSMIFMVGLLFSLIMITTSLSPNSVLHITGMKTIPILARLCMLSFDIYLGWIVAATIANFSVLLVKIKWTRFGLSEQFWTIVVLIVGAIIGMLFILISHRYASALAIVWAYCGILIKHISQSGYQGKYPLIITVAILGIFVILAAGLFCTLNSMGAIKNTVGAKHNDSYLDYQ